jgi:PRC-barrel domain
MSRFMRAVAVARTQRSGRCPVIPFPADEGLDTRFSTELDQFNKCIKCSLPAVAEPPARGAPFAPQVWVDSRLTNRPIQFAGELFHMRTTMTMLAGVLCASLAVAQDTTTTTTTVQYQRVSSVVGTTVVLGTETIGKVTEIVINDQGCIEYLIVQYGDGFVPIPWTVTTVNFERRTFAITSTEVTVARLKDLTFTEARWPNFGDRTFTEKVRTVWGSAATRSESGAKGSRPGTGTTPKTDTKERPKIDPTKKDPKDKKDPDKKDPKDKKDPDKKDG